MFKIILITIFNYIWICIINIQINTNTCLGISEINDSNCTRDRRVKLGLFCYKVLILFVKQYNVIWKWIWKCILQILGQLIFKKLKKGSLTDILIKERKWNHLKCSIKTTKTEKEWKIKIGKKNKATSRKQ